MKKELFEIDFVVIPKMLIKDERQKISKYISDFKHEAVKKQSKKKVIRIKETI